MVSEPIRAGDDVRYLTAAGPAGPYMVADVEHVTVGNTYQRWLLLDQPVNPLSTRSPLLRIPATAVIEVVHR